ncbi:hypothetical protein [Candidatus Uabimicrobium amorphum]|uniref:Uncharacterized protein n=1 Tax=Uabimicrobium amorphum TaxID=2596890 RepID=A0A5S9INU3_UABAM|nr:hypothetical protein [Candidatus Uabimicrobium amorphum]BBM84947.1 hypothetical protein UABAM_03308 [Candidatus Uabimicrobium amorphum]
MRLSDYIVDHLHFKINSQLQLSLMLPNKTGGICEEHSSFNFVDGKKNILYISSARACKTYKKSNYNLICINYQLRDEVFDILEKDAKVEKKQIIHSFIQSDSNLAVVLIIDEDIYYVDAIRIVRFLRKSLRSNIPIHIYVLLPIINDLLYSRLLLLDCECYTPFAPETFYGKHTPQQHQHFLHTVDKIRQDLPQKQDPKETQVMDIETYQNYNFDEYNIPTIFDTSSVKFNSCDYKVRIDTNAYSTLNTQRQASTPIGLDVFPDIELYLTLSVLWKSFSKIVLYINSLLGKKLQLLSVYKSSLNTLDSEMHHAPQYQIFYSSIENSLLEIFENPRQESNYLVETNGNHEEINTYIFYYYHLMCRLTAIIVYNINDELEREEKVKIAVKIVEILKKDVGLFPIPVRINDRWAELSILDIFKHFRKNKL